MHRRSFPLLASTFLLTGCSVIAGVAAPDRSAKTVDLVLPPTILVGDTVQAKAEAKDGSGRPPKGDLTVTWASSNPAAIFVTATGRVTGGTVGNQADISATIQGVTASMHVTVGDDQRLGYALAEQLSAPAPYAPDFATSFNSSGGTMTVTRVSLGAYAVRFAGLGRTQGQRDNLQVTGYGASGGVFCKLAGWQSSGADLVADVRCFTQLGVQADGKFTILLSGARPYNPNSRFGFALVPDFTGTIALDTSGTTRNNVSGLVFVGHTVTGVYTLEFPGLERVNGPLQGPETIQVTAVGAGPERCRLNAVDPPAAAMQVVCVTTGGVPADSRFSVMLFQRGRQPPLRFAYALADNPSSTVDYVPAPGYSRNNSGGTITARRTGTGVYLVIFGGQAKAPGATETILLTPFADDRMCATTSWANSGADLTVTLSCFDASGAPANSRFNILLVQ